MRIVFYFLQFQISFTRFHEDFSEKITIFLYLVISVLVTIVCFYFLIRYSEKIIDFFKLDKNFDNAKISINNFDTKNLLTISVFIIGIFMIINNLIPLISGLYYEFEKSNNPAYTDNILNPALNPALNIILGSALIIFKKNIAEYFEK